MADIFSAATPLLIVSKVVGLAPFYVEKKKKSLKASVPFMAYSGLILILFSVNAAFFMYSKVVFKDERIESYIGLATDVILHACGITVTVFSILLTIIQRKKYISVVDNFYSVGFEMAKLNEKIPYHNLVKYSVMHMVVLLFTLLVLLLHNIFYVQRISLLFHISYMCASFAPKLFNFLMELQFVSGALLLKIHFSLLNKSLTKFEEVGRINKDPNRILDLGINNNAWSENLDSEMKNKISQNFAVWEGQMSKFRTRKVWCSDGSTPPGPLFLDKIKIIRKIHSNLCEIKEYLNSSFSLQLLTSVAQAFIFITANLYLIFTTLSSPAQTSVFSLSYPIIWSVTHTIELVIIVVTCTQTSKTANHTAVLVHKLLAKECPSDLRNQIIGAATTYLVILIQFHNTYEVPHDV